MIYIYGSGGRAKLIKEILIRHKVKSQEIKFIDDYIKGYKKTSYLLNNFNKKKISYILEYQIQNCSKKNILFLKEN